MAKPLRLFIVAGEHSGDVLGAHLVRDLQSTGEVELSGVGGPEIEALGLRSLFPMSDLAVMGFVDVLPRLPLLFRRAQEVADAIVRDAPDVVVMVDAQVFSATVARKVRKAGGRMPILLYVAPSVWAWKPGRARRLVGVFDEVLAILPFEPKVMDQLGGPPTSYVGHPAIESTTLREAVPERGPLLLLPGSRGGEVRRHLPLMRLVAETYANHPRVTGFVIPTVVAMKDRIEREVAGWPLKPTVIAGDARRNAIANSVAACAVMGTITLELAAAGVPMVAAYRPEVFQIARIGLLGIKRYSLPNIILGRTVVPEIMYWGPEPASVVAAMGELLAAGSAQLGGFRELRATMREGVPDAPRVSAAGRVLARAGR